MTQIWNRIFSGDLNLRFHDSTTTTTTLVSPLRGKETVSMERQFQLWQEQEVTKRLETTVATEEISVDSVMATELAHKQYVLVNWPVKILYGLFSFSQWTFVICSGYVIYSLWPVRFTLNIHQHNPQKQTFNALLSSTDAVRTYFFPMCPMRFLCFAWQCPTLLKVPAGVYLTSYPVFMVLDFHWTCRFVCFVSLLT